MTEQRSVSVAELETLQAVLVQVLPRSESGDLAAIATECATAVKGAFDELYGKRHAPQMAIAENVAITELLRARASLLELQCQELGFSRKEHLSGE